MTKHHFSTLFKSSCLRYIWKANSHRPATRIQPRHFAAKRKYFRMWHHLMTTIRWNESGRENNWMLMSQPTDINLRFFIVCVCAVAPGRCEIFLLPINCRWARNWHGFCGFRCLFTHEVTRRRSQHTQKTEKFSRKVKYIARKENFSAIDLEIHFHSEGPRKRRRRWKVTVSNWCLNASNAFDCRYQISKRCLRWVTSHNFWFSSLVFWSLQSAPKLTWEIFLFAFISFSHKNINFFSDEHRNSSLCFAPHKFWL